MGIYQDWILSDECIEFQLLIYFFNISGLVIENTYLLKCHHVRSRSTVPHVEVHAEISTHPFVKLADQQIIKSRQKRQLWGLPQQPVIQPSEFENLAHFNDQRYTVHSFSDTQKIELAVSRV